MKKALVLALAAFTLPLFAQSDQNLSVDAVSKQAAQLTGKMVFVSGVVDHLEKDALNTKTFLVVLDGGLYCRVDLAQLSPSGYKAKLSGTGLGHATLSASGSRLGSTVGGMQVRDGHLIDAILLAKGECVLICGTVKSERGKTFLSPAVIKDSDNKSVRAILGLDDAP